MSNSSTSDRKKVLISGASSGIGAATVRRFGAEGWDVCLNARRQTLLDRIVGELPRGEHLVCPGDYSDPQVAQFIAETIAGRWGRLDVLVNCAGVWKPADAIEVPVQQWRRCLDTMIDGALRMSRASVSLMNDGGRIIHVTSIQSRFAEAKSSSYGMAKAAIEQLCRVLAIELADRKILVNAIAPGFVDTPMSVNNGVNELHTDWFRRNYAEGHHLPLRRAAQPEEIAGVALFLAGEDATYITGQVVVVDGGLTITF